MTSDISNTKDAVEMNPTEQTPVFIDVDDTAMAEYLDIISNEYEIERNKKQSFENRAGLIMALMGTICIFLFEKVQLQDVYALTRLELTFINLIKIFSGLLVYIGFLYTFIMLIRIVSVNRYNNFDVRCIDEDLLTEYRTVAICRAILTYKDIIVQHRDQNEHKAATLRKALCGMAITIVAVIIYIAIL